MGRLNSTWFTLFIAFSVVGIFASSVVLYTYYYLHTQPPLCTLNGLRSPFPGVTIDCLKVLSSRYADVFDMPLDALALIWFILNIIAVVAYSYAGDRLSMLSFRFLVYWRFLGLAIIPYLLFVEFAILRAVCLYCTIMHAMIIADFAVVTVYAYKYNLGLIRIGARRL